MCSTTDFSTYCHATEVHEIWLQIQQDQNNAMNRWMVLQELSYFAEWKFIVQFIVQSRVHPTLQFTVQSPAFIGTLNILMEEEQKVYREREKVEHDAISCIMEL